MPLFGRVRYPQPYRRLSRAGPLAVATLRYGGAPDQRVEVRHPPAGARGLAVLLHGGFWRQVWRSDLLNALAVDLAGRGWVACSVEYRRETAGREGAGAWRPLLEDVAAGFDACVDHAGAGHLPAVLVGHDAGGQLAIWLAQRERQAGRAVAGVVALAGIGDLAGAARQNLGAGAVQDLLGGDPEAAPDAYAAADPRRRLPVGSPLLLVHGEADEAVPAAMSRAFEQAARSAGDTVELVVLPRVGHSALVDPAQPLWQDIHGWLDRPGVAPHR